MLYKQKQSHVPAHNHAYHTRLLDKHLRLLETSVICISTIRSRLDERTEHVQLTQKQRNERTMNSIIAR